MTRNFASVGQFNYAVRAFCPSVHSFLRRQNFNAETLRLHYRPACEITTAKASRKAEIIFDARTHSCLTARRFPLNHHRAQAFRRAINSSGKAGWASADDRQIVEIGLGPRAQPDFLR